MADDDATPTFVLTTEQKSRLKPDIDVDALERFLRVVASTNEERDILLRSFARDQGRNKSFSVIRAVNADPAINALLDEIWAPTWEAYGEDAIAASEAEGEAKLPGRDIAKARLAARRRDSSAD